jgi:hypothetical protein
MLSIEKCREYLEGKKLTDKEVLEIRDNLYGLAEIAIEKYIKDKKSNISKISE